MLDIEWNPQAFDDMMVLGHQSSSAGDRVGRIFCTLDKIRSKKGPRNIPCPVVIGEEVCYWPDKGIIILFTVRDNLLYVAHCVSRHTDYELTQALDCAADRIRKNIVVN